MNMTINERTLSPTFTDPPRDRGRYADCDWEPYCLTHGDCCEDDPQNEHGPCVRPSTPHPLCDGTWKMPA